MPTEGLGSVQCTDDTNVQRELYPKRALQPQVRGPAEETPKHRKSRRLPEVSCSTVFTYETSKSSLEHAPFSSVTYPFSGGGTVQERGQTADDGHYTASSYANSYLSTGETERSERYVNKSAQAASHSDICVVCREARVSAVALPCGHARFCWECLNRLFSTNRQCALCRDSITAISPVFL